MGMFCNQFKENSRKYSQGSMPVLQGVRLLGVRSFPSSLQAPGELRCFAFQSGPEQAEYRLSGWGVGGRKATRKTNKKTHLVRNSGFLCSVLVSEAPVFEER